MESGNQILANAICEILYFLEYKFPNEHRARPMKKNDPLEDSLYRIRFRKFRVKIQEKYNIKM